MKNYLDYNLKKSSITKTQYNDSRKKTFSRFFKLFSKHKKGLDLGTASGWLVKEMNNRGCEWEGTDYDEKLQDFIYPNKKYDLIVSLNIIEHQSKEQIEKFLDFCKKHTRYVFISTNNPKCLNAYYTLYNDFTHTRLITYNSLSALLSTYGFETIEIKEFDNIMKNKPVRRFLSKKFLDLIGIGKFNFNTRYYVYAKKI